MRIGIALGANLGNRLGSLRAARDFLLHLPGGDGTPAAVSPVYETEPVGCPQGTAPFLNAVMEIGWCLEPAALHRELLVLEEQAGRPAAERAKNLPRALDLDLLYAGDQISRDPSLLLPHPRMAGRRFVLQPLADLRPDLVLPGQTRSVIELLAALPPEPTVQLHAKDW